jgi:capsular exopolysaccharide synthesis family protein
MPVLPGSPYGPAGWSGGPAPARPKNAPTAGGLLKALKRRWVIATLVGLMVAAAVATGVWLALPAGKHQARVLVEVKPRTDLSGRPVEDFDAFRRGQQVLIKTRDLITRTLAEPQVAALPTIKNSEDPVRYLERGLKADFIAPEIMAVTLPGDSLEDLQIILDSLVVKYIDEVSGSERISREAEIKRLTKMADESQQSIMGREQQIRLMVTATGSTGVESAGARSARLQMQLVRLDQDIFQKQRDIEDLRAQIALYRAKLKEGRIEIKPEEMERWISAAPPVKRVAEKLMEREERLARELKIAGPTKPGEEEPPTIAGLRTEIESNKKELDAVRERVRPEVTALLKSSSRDNLEVRVRDLEDRLAASEATILSDKGIRDRLQRDITDGARESLDVALYLKDLEPEKEHLQKLRTKIQDLKSVKDQDARMKVREKAVGAANENLNRKTLFSSVAAVGSFFGVLILIGFFEWRTRRIDGVDQVVDEIGMRIIGTVPRFPNRASLKAAEAAGNANWRFVLNESINSARTMLLHAAKSQSMQVVMVTSATQGEGKTSLASQMATSMAAAGLRTLIIDCDLRNPSIHKLFDLTLNPGVSEILRQEVDVSDAVQPTAVPNLWAVPAGQCSNGVITALAQGHPLETLFNRLRGQFDFIMVDACPILPVADALLVGQHVDGVVFSIMQDISQLPKVLVASEKLHQLNIPLVGAVVNGIPTGEMYSYGYNYVKQLPA